MRNLDFCIDAHGMSAVIAYLQAHDPEITPQSQYQIAAPKIAFRARMDSAGCEQYLQYELQDV